MQGLLHDLVPTSIRIQWRGLPSLVPLGGTLGLSLLQGSTFYPTASSTHDCLKLEKYFTKFYVLNTAHLGRYLCD
jgi:hypothetical protein